MNTLKSCKFAAFTILCSLVSYTNLEGSEHHNHVLWPSQSPNLENNGVANKEKIIQRNNVRLFENAWTNLSGGAQAQPSYADGVLYWGSNKQIGTATLDGTPLVNDLFATDAITGANIWAIQLLDGAPATLPNPTPNNPHATVTLANDNVIVTPVIDGKYLYVQTPATVPASASQIPFNLIQPGYTIAGGVTIANGRIYIPVTSTGTDNDLTAFPATNAFGGIVSYKLPDNFYTDGHSHYS